MTLYKSAWLCITQLESLWLCKTLFDFVWFCMISYDPVRLCETLYDSGWLWMTLYDSLWRCMTLSYSSVWLWMTLDDSELHCMGGKSLENDSLQLFSNQIFNLFTFVYHTQMCTNFVLVYLVHSSELLRYFIYRAHPYGPYGGKVLCP